MKSLLAGEGRSRLEWHRISGDCCYLLKLEAGSHAHVEAFLDELLHHANYRLNLALSSTAQEDQA